MNFCSKSYQLKSVSPVLCAAGDWRVRIKNYAGDFVINPACDPSVMPNWLGRFADYNPNAFGTGGCDYQRAPNQFSIQGKVLAHCHCTNVYPGRPLNWTLILMSFAGGNSFIWIGKKVIVPGDDPTGIYTYDPTLFGATSDTRATLEIEAYDITNP